MLRNTVQMDDKEYGMRVSYNLSIGFWSRIKLLFGYPIYVEVSGRQLSGIKVAVLGEETVLKVHIEFFLGPDGEILSKIVSHA